MFTIALNEFMNVKQQVRCHEKIRHPKWDICVGVSWFKRTLQKIWALDHMNARARPKCRPLLNQGVPKIKNQINFDPNPLFYKRVPLSVVLQIYTFVYTETYWYMDLNKVNIEKLRLSGRPSKTSSHACRKRYRTKPKTTFCLL